jgi:hypothetical protein
MSPPSASAAQFGKEDNPYTRAFHRETGINRITQTEKESNEPAYPMPHNRMRTTRQSNKLLCAKQHSLREAIEQMIGLNRGVAKFLAAATPTIGDLMEHTQQQHTQFTHPMDKFVPTTEVLERAQVNKEARESVR